MSRARSELVAVAFIKTMSGIATNGMVATQLPEDNTSWAASGFIRCGPVVGGSPALYVPIRKPVIQVTCYAVNPNTMFPDWGKAEELANLIVEGSYDMSRLHKALTVRSGVSDALVMNATVLTEPNRIPNDVGAYASYVLDLELTWKEI